MTSNSLTRRKFLSHSALAAGTLLATDAFKGAIAQPTAPAIVPSERMRPQIPYGVAVGDLTNGQAIVWSRCDRPAQLIVEYTTDESFRRVQRLNPRPVALATRDYTARVNLTNLPPNQDIFYRVRFQDLADESRLSAPVMGRFRTPPAPGDRDILFAWSGDTAGQGWGINPAWGGMKLYETMRQFNPDFFIHSGDTIYADNPIQAEVKLKDGTTWRNLTTPEKAKVAETLAEFRGNYIYNLLDENVRRFNAEVPLLMQWDDHEVTNNWFPGRQLEDDRYTIKDCGILAARARQAFLEYTPLRPNPTNADQIYRSFSYGSNLDILMIDKRSYRGPNSNNLQTSQSPETAFLGNSQMQWLKQKLLSSKATWKIIASDMPIGLVVPDGKTNFENLANGNGVALGRELELAELLRFIKQKNIRNVVWLTADVHYAAAHYYNPNNAQFADFKPFWEFVAGPINSGTFGPNKLDNTFGPEVKFNSVAAEAPVINLPPSQGLQFFGTVKIDRATQLMTVALHNLEGKTLYNVELPPEV